MGGHSVRIYHHEWTHYDLKGPLEEVVSLAEKLAETCKGACVACGIEVLKSRDARGRLQATHRMQVCANDVAAVEQVIAEETSILSEEERTRLAFDLLTSSSIGRYCKLVVDVVHENDLPTRIRNSETFAERACWRFDALQHALEAAPEQRSEHEGEFAVLMVALQFVLEVVAPATVPSMQWPAALAQKILEGR